MAAFHDRGRALSFGNDAEGYDRARPGYTASLFDDLFELAPAEPSIIEVGAGTGKATVELARRAAKVIALEPSTEMAAVLRRATAQARNVEVVETEFERWEEAGAEMADLSVAAQAWHWVDPGLGLPKARRLLRPGGAVAFWWDRPRRVSGDLFEAIRAVYSRFAPELVEPGRPGATWSTTNAAVDGIERCGLFGSSEIRVYEWEHLSTSSEYVSVSRTLSAHRALPDSTMERLMDGVKLVIEQSGGQVNVGYQTELVIASVA